jgi:hypothetical protein
VWNGGGARHPFPRIDEKDCERVRIERQRLVLSPGSIPIVTDCCPRLAFTAGFGFCRELPLFFMAGLLCTSSAYSGAYRIPWTPAFSFHLGERTGRIGTVRVSHRARRQIFRHFDPQPVPVVGGAAIELSGWKRLLHN